MSPEKTDTDNTSNTSESLEIVLGSVLRWGTIVSAIVIAAGGIAYLAHNGNETPHYETFRGEPPELKSISGIVTDALAFHPPGIIQLGMLLLVATPIARVAAALLGFAVRRDLTYVIISAVILMALAYGLLAS
jgi:uncharacterized membrane protein